MVDNTNDREIKYDNLKFILIYFVIFGHILDIAKMLYPYKVIIYSFHMPV